MFVAIKSWLRFNRYATLDVVRAVADSGRRDIALYTGNDDAIVAESHYGCFRTTIRNQRTL